MVKPFRVFLLDNLGSKIKTRSHVAPCFFLWFNKNMISAKGAIVGAGPSGITFLNSILKDKNIKRKDILFIDKNRMKCSNLYSHGIYFENIRSKCPQKYKFLVNGKKPGIKIVKYFKEKCPYNPIKKNIIKIKKVNNDFIIYASDNSSYHVKWVAIATGVSPKKIKCLDYGESIYNLSYKSFKHISKIDYTKSDIIFIGSGENVAMKASRLSKYVVDNKIKHSKWFIKIFLKNKFKAKINKKFIDEIKKYKRLGIIKLYKGLWDIKKVKINKNGLVHKIITQKNTFISKTLNGSYINAHIGFEINIPKLINCGLEDLILIGDINRLNKNKVCTIYDAIEDALINAKKII